MPGSFTVQLSTAPPPESTWDMDGAGWDIPAQFCSWDSDDLERDCLGTDSESVERPVQSCSGAPRRWVLRSWDGSVFDFFPGRPAKQSVHSAPTRAPRLHADALIQVLTSYRRFYSGCGGRFRAALTTDPTLHQFFLTRGRSGFADRIPTAGSLCF